MSTEIVIIVASIIAAILVVLLVVAAIQRTRHVKKEVPQHHVGVVSMDGIVIDTSKKRKMSATGTVAIPSPPQLDRAQKFRERARSTTIGRPQFKFSTKKSDKREIYQAIGNQAEFETVDRKDAPPRRTSEDTASHNSDNAPGTPPSVVNFEDDLNHKDDTICTDV